MTRIFQRAVRRLIFAPRALALALCGLALAFAGCGKSANASKQMKDGEDDTSLAAKSGSKTNAPAPLVVVAEIPRSAFSTRIEDGRDPFFPESDRRSPRLTQNGTPAPAPRAQPLSDLLNLTALWSAKPRPLAMINQTPLKTGEEARIKVMVNRPNGPESHRLLVRCLEIRSNSVVIRVEGESDDKELFLKSKI